MEAIKNGRTVISAGGWGLLIALTIGSLAQAAIIPPEHISQGQQMAAYAMGSFSTGRNVSIDGNVAAGAGGLGNRASLHGSFYSAGDAYLSTHASVTGNLTAGGNLSINQHANVAGAAGYGIDYWKAGSAQVVGGISQSGSAITLSAVDAPDTGPGGSYQWLSNNATVSLAAGDYGGLSLGNRVQLTLTSGTYHFDSVWLGNKTQLHLDTSAGDIQIIVAGNFTTGSNVTTTNLGMGDLTVHAGSDIWLGSNFSGEGAYLAHGSKLGIGENARLQGQIYSAGDIWIANNSQLSFMAGGGSAGAAAIPEPASGILLLAAVTVMMFRPARR